ncbi:MAG: tagaturonate epimerase family protein [Candidatus Acetothermia bacterium]|jgi:hypothetical protein|nr:tagaturonate epimerase family protein [Candidatus Acetothermia bacterium]
MIPNQHEVYPASVHTVGQTVFALVRGPDGRRLFLSSPVPGFAGDPLPSGGVLCPVSFANARALTKVFPWLSPQRVSSGPGFGFGDRLGLATPGHIRALRGAKVFPALAQQSVRENARTGRTFEDVLVHAIFGAFQEGYQGGFGADADHLKEVEDALHGADLGYTFFTCDPSDHVVAVERLPLAEVAKRFRSLPDADRLCREYLGREFILDGGRTLRFTEEDLARAAVKHGGAVAFAVEMYRALVARLPQGFDFELSVDETETPTTPLEHLFIALELRRHDVALASLAPRFPGAMEKAVDWRGDPAHFRRELRAHVAIARAFGPYRLSLHSGSDKFSLYPILAEEADGLWHVKTAGTSYLVALEVAARFAPPLFRKIVRLSLDRFPEDRKSYHLSADLRRLPVLETLPDARLLELLAQDDARQVLHVAFGSVLKSPLGEELRRVLSEHEEEHYEALAQHLGRHLELLEVKDDG